MAMNPMTRFLSVALLFAAVAAVGQDPGLAGIAGPRVLPAPPALLQQFDVMAGSLQELQLPAGTPANTAVEVVLGGSLAQLQLWQHEVRAPGYTLIERAAFGELAVPAGPCTTYRGEIAGDAGSEVAASLRAGSLTAWIRRGDGGLWLVQAVREVSPTAGAALHVVYRGSDSSNLPVRCGTQTPPVGTLPALPDTDVVYACQLGLEADFAFFQANGSSVSATQNDVLAVVNAMDVIYRRDTQIAMQVGTLIVNSTADPYTSSVAGTLLNQFAGYWNAVRGNVQRDVAHLFTGRPMGQVSSGTIGVAFLATVCNLGSAYGVSQSRFSNNWNYRVGVTAHELGHNFGAGHCDAAASCRIMCSGVGGCTNTQTSFGPTEQNQIVAYRQSVNCLQVLSTTPVITSATPTLVRTFQPGLVVLGGSGFTGVNRLTVGGVAVTSGITVLSDTQLRFTPPAGLAIGVQQLTATNSAGTSLASGLFYTGANPALLTAPVAVLGGSLVTWQFGGWPLDPAFLVLSLQSSTTPFQGQPLLDGFSVLWVGGLDARGMGSYTVPVPAGVLNGVRAYSQLVDIDGPTLTVRSTSNVTSTLVIQ